jgi:hypothetical protein
VGEGLVYIDLLGTDSLVASEVGNEIGLDRRDRPCHRVLLFPPFLEHRQIRFQEAAAADLARDLLAARAGQGVGR